MARTKVYRILDKLSSRQLVEQQITHRGLQFGATHPSKFSLLLKEKEHETQLLKETLPAVLGHLEKIAYKKNEKTKVLYYSGTDGIKQIFFNATKAKGELLTYESSYDMTTFLPHKFSEEIRREFVNNKVSIRVLLWQKNLASWTKVEELIKTYWQARYLDPQQLKLKSEVFIYNNVYVFYSYDSDNKSGVEIYNEDLANIQRQLFEINWVQAKSMRLLN